VWPTQKAAGAKLAREWLLARGDWRISPSRTCVRRPGHLGQIRINQPTMTSLFIRDLSQRWSGRSSLIKISELKLKEGMCLHVLSYGD